MNFRMDWAIHFRANQLAGAQKLFRRLAERLGEPLTEPTFQPDHRMWGCRFSTGDWAVPFSEAVVRCMQLAGEVSTTAFWIYGTPDETADDTLFSGTFYVTGQHHPTGTWLTGLEWASFSLVRADTEQFRPTYDDVVARNTSLPYDIGILAEHWEPSGWSRDDGDSEITVTFSSGAYWKANFVTYRHLEIARIEHRESGDMLGSRYYCMPDMVIVDDLGRETVEAVIHDMLESLVFASVFHFEGVSTESDDLLFS